MTDQGIVPPETSMLRRRRRRRRTALATVAVVLAAAGVWGAITVSGACGSLDSGVQDIDGTCVGVNDGSYVFHPELADILGRIEEENARVRAEGGSVSVALLDPLTPTETSALPLTSVRNRLEGAYTAQRRVNTSHVAGDPNPRIQLLLANQGSTDDQWTHVLDRLRELSVAEEHPLLAVVGLGVSTARTRKQAEDLADSDIPMVGAVLTADDLEHDAISGLIKTSPSNRHYVAALRHHMRMEGLDTAIMVRDSNSEEGIDLYTRSLEEEFEEQLEKVISRYRTQQFTGKSASGDSTPSLFAGVQVNICASAADGNRAVLYAGREIDLGDLLRSLQNRTCRETPLTLLTAGLELGKVLADPELDLRAAKLTILNAATVDPLGWSGEEPGTPVGYPDFHGAFVQHFPANHLLDGGAIMTHDALLTAARAIRLAAPNGAASYLTPERVRGQLLNLNGEFVVTGASGTLEFSDGRKDEGTGVPGGKPIPVLRYPSVSDRERASERVGDLCHIVAGPKLVACGPAG